MGRRCSCRGTGGDEVFFGYRSHQVYRQYERIRPATRAAVAPLLASVARIATQMLGVQSHLARRVEKFHRGLTVDGLDRHLALADWSSPALRSAILSDEVCEQVGEDVPPCMQKYRDRFAARIPERYTTRTAVVVGTTHTSSAPCSRSNSGSRPSRIGRPSRPRCRRF